MAVWSEANIGAISQNKRMDSEFFDPKYIDLEKIVEKTNHSLLGTLGQFVIGPFGSAFHVNNYNPDSCFRYIRGKDVKPFTLLENDNVYMPENDFDRLKKYAIQQNDLIISVVGTLGNVAIIPEDEKGIFSCKSTLFRNSQIDAHYLLAYLNSKYGNNCLLRRQRGAVQMGLNKEDLKTVPVTIVSDADQVAIGGWVRKALALSKKSKEYYFDAQQCLEQELGLDKLKFEKPVGYETSFNEIVEANRVDAQCYKPNFVNYEKYLKQNGKYTVLKALIPPMVKGKQMATVPSGLLFYASIKDIDGIELQSDSYCLPTKETQIAKKGDLLLAITGATIGKIGIVNKYERLAFSGDLLKLEINDDINPYYLLTVMQSPIGKSQCNRWVTGSTNGHLAPKDVGKIVIPRLDKKEEERIGKKIPKSLKLKKQSKQFLEKAKKMVEDLIEQAAGEP